jgi:hypothetical protein
MPSGKHGRNTTCKACRSSYLKKYREANREALVEASRRRYIEKKEEYQEAGRRNYEKNKEAYKARAKKWVEKNPGKRKAAVDKYNNGDPVRRYESGKKHRLSNPGYYAAAYKARQQRKRQAMPFWANEESIKAIYRQAAWVEKMTGIKQHVDHYYPLKNDLVCGLHVENNLRIIPAFDNLSKGNKFPTEE